MAPDPVVTVHEESSFSITAPDTGGLIRQQLAVSLATVSAFAANWLAIYDEWRLLKVQFRYHSASGTNTNGAMVSYIERQPIEAPALTLLNAYREQESTAFRPFDDFTSSPKLTSLEWIPKSPADYEYHRVATDTIFEFDVVGENFVTGSPSPGRYEVIARIQFRGRQAPLG